MGTITSVLGGVSIWCWLTSINGKDLPTLQTKLAITDTLNRFRFTPLNFANQTCTNSLYVYMNYSD